MDEIEDLALRKYAAIKSATEETVCVSKAYIDMTGDFFAALVLDELLFWTLPKGKKTSLRSRHENRLWLAVGRAEWWERKRLTERQSDNAIAKLVEMGLVEKKIFKFQGAPRVHLRLIAKKFFDLLGNTIATSLPQDELDDNLQLDDLYEMMGLDTSRFHQTVKSISPNGEILISPNREILNSPTLTYNPTTGTLSKPSSLPLSEMPVEWQIMAGAEQITLPPNQEEQSQLDYALMNLCHNNMQIEPLAKAFMQTRKIYPNKGEIKGWRVKFQEMYAKGVRAQHVEAAVKQLLEKEMTVSSPYSIYNTAVDLANKPQQMTFEGRMKYNSKGELVPDGE